jgi:peptidoglycan/LPS O-acetylase OafA/YrhL
VHKNNFDFFRLLFAVFVVITHSYSLAGLKENDILAQITSGQTSLSYIGVRGFFIISGYLIFQSMERSRSLSSYYLKRILRLFPGLVVVLLLTICFSAFAYNGTLLNYLSNRTMWSYFPNNVSLYNLQFGIDGVFDGNALNGSLWTLRYEFTFYILISAFFMFRNNNTLPKKLLIFLFIGLLAAHFFLLKILGTNANVINSPMSLNLGLYFFSGSLLAALGIANVKFKVQLIIISFILLCLCIYLKLFILMQFLLLPPIITLAGISSTKFINSLSDKIGDISYGIYIYSFPIQVLIVNYYHLNYIQLMTYSLMLSVLFGLFSWHVIEKKALRFKNLKLLHA